MTLGINNGNLIDPVLRDQLPGVSYTITLKQVSRVPGHDIADWLCKCPPVIHDKAAKVPIGKDAAEQALIINENDGTCPPEITAFIPCNGQGFLDGEVM